MRTRRSARTAAERDEEPILYEPPGWLALHDRWMTWAVVLTALAVRAVYLWQLRRSPFWDDLPVDLGYYRDWALRIAAGEWEGKEVFEQSPLYAYFLAVIFKFFGPGLLAPRVIQIVIGAFTCGLIHRITRQLFSPGAGLAAGLMAALYAPFLFYDGMIMKEVLAVFFFAWMLVQLIEADGRQRGLLATAGLALGLGALVRDNMILVAPAAALWLLVDPWLRQDLRHGQRPASGPAKIREGIARATAFSFGVLLVLAPVAARNYHVSGEFIPQTSGGGEVFYIGNNPEADGRYSPPPFVRAASGVEHEDFRVEAARRLGKPRDAVSRNESSRFWMAEATGWIRTHPSDWARLMIEKVVIFFNHYELPDNQSFAHHRLFLPILNVPLLVWGFLAPLALGGAVLSAARFRDMLPLWLIGGAYIGSVLLFFNFGRFRMPAVVVLLVLAGGFMSELSAAIRKRRIARPLIGIVVAVLAFRVVGRDIEADPVHLGQSHAQAGVLLARDGRIAEAEREVAEGIRMLEEFRSSTGNRPLGVSFDAVLAEAYSARAEIAQGKTQPAAAFEKTLQQAEALHKAGSPREALALVEKAIADAGPLKDEALAASHYGRALIYRDLGDLPKMREHLAACLRLNPSHPRAVWIRSQIGG